MGRSDVALAEGGRELLVDRAMRLFEFLGRVQQLKSSPPRTVDSYPSVLWLGDVPDHPAVTAAHRAVDPGPDDVLLTIDRTPRLDPPEPDEPLAPWLDGRLDDPDIPPNLRESITVVDDSPTAYQSSRQVIIGDRPDVRERYGHWLARWRSWADRERRDRPVRQLYGELFSTYVAATGHPEELELVAGVGCLAWTPPQHAAVRRHLLTAPVAVHFDDDTGRLSVVRVESIDAIGVELDMLDPRLTNSPHINEIRNHARLLETHPLHREEIGSLVRRLVHNIDADGEYRDQDQPPASSARAVAAFAPAIILRKRSQQGLVDIFRTIVGQLAEAGDVPDGVRPLIDPNHRPGANGEPSDGAVVIVDDEPFLPLPVNDVQLRIIRQVDAKAQTLVQGPPGTGKTHTAAALLCHLLAQGKRVLVTAHTDRALKEVRAKLPAAFKPLSVAIVGSSREDMSDLKVAVERIAAAATEHDPDGAEAEIRRCLETIDLLRGRRAELYRELIDAREREVREHEHAGYRGTLAKIAQRHRTDAERFAWLTEYVHVRAGSEPPNPQEIVEWRDYLLDAALATDEPEARQRLPEISALPEPRAFADLVAAERFAIAADEGFVALQGHPAYAAVSRLGPEARGELQRRLHQLAGEADDLARRREAWMNDALSDIRNGRAGIWQARGQQITELLHRADPLVRQLGPTTEVQVTGAPAATLVPLAMALYEYLRGGGKLKTVGGGTPRLGAFADKAVKQAQPVFDAVRVNGLPPVTLEQVGAFLTWAEATRLLDALDRGWPETVRIPRDDSLHERLQWHITELQQLHRVLRLGEWLDAEERNLAAMALPRPDWNDLRAVRTYAGLVDAAAARDALITAGQPVNQLEQALAEAARWADAASCGHDLLAAVRQRDHDAYATAYQRLRRLREVRRIAERRDTIAARLSAAVPGLHRAIAANPSAAEWTDRLGGFTGAWRWASTGTWIAEQGTTDVNALQAEIADLEARIRHQVEVLAATRAWGHAVSAERLTGQARANLEQYAYLVRKLGKGTGKYAAQRRAEIRQAMDRCRPAVPVWIMPIYRIAEQLQVQPDMFDVAIVDEASQAGLEATFLQYLAPKMVVIGDDKQVSPSAVGVDQQQLRDLARQYLADDPYATTWQEPQRSLFDEAKMRFGGLLTLIEHRRCVPEIIGFSNQIAYQPEGIRLIPVRQYGADRLEPIKAVFLPDGCTTGSASKVNPVEARAIVDQVEKCIADPRYDGHTMGVISLLGMAQAKAIERLLQERIPFEELVARDLRCGDSADFQGSERHVMFLSMVATTEPDKRLGALTHEQYVQRYNVAASRAKDQMWLFHSVPVADLGNPDDMRFKLLDYCYGVLGRGRRVDDRTVAGAVPEDRLVDPFQSLFEQRVFNRLVESGYPVIPQYQVEPYRLDLVVVGAKTRLAIECDGDTWHGPEAYERDLARQRDLERCGWRFFRIRESAFYVDQQGVLENLSATLRELNIHPSGWEPEEPEPEPEPEFDEPEPESETMPVVEEPTSTVDVVTDEREFVAAEEVEADEPPVVAAPAPELPPVLQLPAVDLSLAPYEEFTGSLTPALDASRRQLFDGLRAIVAVEGPVVGHRLHSAYVKASGGRRVGPLIANALNSTITAAVREGALIEDNPLNEPGVKPRTYRLPDQPAVRIREPGPRSFEQLPPAELAAILSRVAKDLDPPDDEILYRATLALLGLKRLTPNVTNRLRAIHQLAQREQ